MNSDIQSLANEALAALLLGGAQGLLITAAVWAALRLFRRANAATRHAVWFATLLIVAILPFLHFVAPRASHLLSLFRPAPDAPATEDAFYLKPTPLQAIPELPPDSDDTNEPSHSAAISSAEPPSASSSIGPVSLNLHAPAYLSACLLALWFPLALFRLAGLARQLIALRSLKNRATPAPVELHGAFADLRFAMRLSRRASLLISSQVPAPMVVGYRRPAVLVPSSLCAEATPPQLAHVFRHELAHLARRDDWANLAQQVISCALFFHPAVHLITRRLTVEREIACDDFALAGRRGRREYALFLTEFAGRMKGRGFTAAPAAWSNKSQLKERISMILDGNRNASPRVSRAGVGLLTTATLSLAVLAFVAAPRLVLADEDRTVTVTTTTTTEDGNEPKTTVKTISTGDDVLTTSFGPRKMEIRRRDLVIAVPPTSPVPALAPLPAHGPNPPRHPQLAAGHPEPNPHPPGPRPTTRPFPPGERSRDEALERRLERLERMIESLVDRDKGGRPEGNSFFFKKEFPGPEFHAEMEEFHRNFKRDLERDVKRNVERDMDRLHRDTEREVQTRTAEAERHAADTARAHAEAGRRGPDAERQSIQARRRGLEAARQAIDKQLRELDEQLERERREIKPDRDEKKSDKDSKKEEKSEKSEKKERAAAEQIEKEIEKIEVK